jgi:hypothetical protein
MIDLLPPLHVVVRFGRDIPLSIQGPALLEMERHLRKLAAETVCGPLWIEVFKEAKGDDSKLRSAMTPAQRAKL